MLDAQPTSNAVARTIVAVAVRHARLCRWDFMTPPDYAERTARNLHGLRLEDTTAVLGCVRLTRLLGASLMRRIG